MLSSERRRVGVIWHNIKLEHRSSMISTIAMAMSSSGTPCVYLIFIYHTESSIVDQLLTIKMKQVWLNNVSVATNLNASFQVHITIIVSTWSLFTKIYIYIYICVCVCVMVYWCIGSLIILKVLLQWNSTSVYTSCTYSTYHLELALGTFICHFISACLVCHTS